MRQRKTETQTEAQTKRHRKTETKKTVRHIRIERTSISSHRQPCSWIQISVATV